jgi:hypothetical protein
MAFKDILLVLITYPEATNASGIHAAVSLTTALGARISAVACVVKVRAPHYPLSDAFIDIPALVDSEMKKSAEASTELIGVFEQAAKSAGVFQESLVKSCLTSGAPDLLVREARLRDLTVLPGIAEGYNYRWYAESIVFGSGRPLLVLPPHVKPDLAFRRIVVAWDGSRSASRAVADALSLLERAEEVRALTILNEKEMNGESPALDLAGSLPSPGSFRQGGENRCRRAFDR